MSGNHNRGPGPVPARWMHCPRKAAATIVNKFLAFKTPLSSAFDDQVPEECRFTPEMLFNSMKSHEVLPLLIFYVLNHFISYLLDVKF